LVEYYFDIETTGLDPTEHKIVTIQWQPLSGLSGEPVGDLQILREWESSEESIIRQFLPNIQCGNPFEFVMVGKNLLFDFMFFGRRATEHDAASMDLRYFYGRVWLDVKSILVMMNHGSFKGYDRIIDKRGELAKVCVPDLYREGKYDDIIRYVKCETQTFLRAYQILKREMPLIGYKISG